MTVTIRLARPSDVPALAALARQTFVDTFGPEGFAIPYPDADLAAFLAESYAHEAVAAWIADPRGHVLVAEAVDGALVAYAQSGDNKLECDAARPDDGELKRLYVLKGCQGTGLGRDLLERSLTWMAGRPIVIGVWSENFKAQRLYAHHGFERVGQYHFMVGDVADEDFILRRDAR